MKYLPEWTWNIGKNNGCFLLQPEEKDSPTVTEGDEKTEDSDVQELPTPDEEVVKSTIVESSVMDRESKYSMFNLSKFYN